MPLTRRPEKERAGTESRLTDLLKSITSFKLGMDLYFHYIIRLPIFVQWDFGGFKMCSHPFFRGLQQYVIMKFDSSQICAQCWESR